MINIRTKFINPTARYYVGMLDSTDDSYSEKIMIGADLKQFACAFGDRYIIDADILPETTENKINI